jgi:hypothetical protein
MNLYPANSSTVYSRSRVHKHVSMICEAISLKQISHKTYSIAHFSNKTIRLSFYHLFATNSREEVLLIKSEVPMEQRPFAKLSLAFSKFLQIE